MPHHQVGATFGRCFGNVYLQWVGGSWPPPSAFAVASATAALSGLFRSAICLVRTLLLIDDVCEGISQEEVVSTASVFSLCCCPQMVIMFEATGAMSMHLPVLLACIVANAIAALCKQDGTLQWLTGCVFLCINTAKSTESLGTMQTHIEQWSVHQC